MFSKSLLAQSRTLCASLKARNSLSVVLLRHASSGKLSMPLQFQRTLSTSLALRSEESRYEDRSSRSRGFRKPVAPSGTLYVGNLPYSITEDELRRAFSEFGEIVRVALGMFFFSPPSSFFFSALRLGYFCELCLRVVRYRDNAGRDEPRVCAHSIFHCGGSEWGH